MYKVFENIRLIFTKGRSGCDVINIWKTLFGP